MEDEQAEKITDETKTVCEYYKKAPMYTNITVNMMQHFNWHHSQKLRLTHLRKKTLKFRTVLTADLQSHRDHGVFLVVESEGFWEEDCLTVNNVRRAILSKLSDRYTAFSPKVQALPHLEEGSSRAAC